MWIKHGRILSPNTESNWLTTWASATCAIHHKDNHYRLFITGKDIKGRSRIGTALLNIDSLEIEDLLDEPIIPLGRKGTLDQNGTSYPHVIKHNEEYYLYYLGWIQGVQVAWYNGLFLAKSSDGINFNKVSEAPVFDRNDFDPLGVGSMHVLNENGLLTMWYARFDSWGENEYEAKHYYNISHATSHDGINWMPSRVIDINYINPKIDYAIAKPSVLIYSDYYFMWYSFRGDAYRIGVAVSKDGRNWKRMDHLVGIETSSEGWDSEMLCYAHVFRHMDKVYMLYNGNNYGEGGLGIASAHISSLDFLIKEYDNNR